MIRMNTARLRSTLYPILWVLGVLMFGCSVSQVWAGALATDLTVDVRADALGNAVVADPPGVVGAINYNPAGLALLDGRRIDYEAVAVQFAIHNTFSAPPGYNVFGYSDDPVVCQEPNGNIGYCKNFKTGTSTVQGVALYIPVLDKTIDLPPGPALAPNALGVSVQAPGSNLTFADGVFAPMLAGFYRNPNDPGVFLGQQMALERVTYFSPSVGLKINDKWSVGASVNVSYQALSLDTQFRSPNELVGLLRLINDSVCPPFKNNNNIITDLFLFGFCNAQQSVGPFTPLAQLKLSMQDTVSPTYNLGVLWKPNDRFSWGAEYRSESRMHLIGKYEIDYGQGTQDVFNAVGGSATGSIALSILGLPTSIPQKETGLVSMNLTYPQHFQTGISWRAWNPFKLNFDVSWDDYGQWTSFPIQFDRTPRVLQIARLLSPNATLSSINMPLGFQSPWSWGIGTETTLTPRLVFRFGFEQRGSAIPFDKRSSLVPITTAHMWGTGFGYQIDKDSDVDLTLMRLISKDTIPANTSTNFNATGINNVIYNPYAGLDGTTMAQVTMIGMAYRTRW